MLQRRDANIWETAQVLQSGTSSVGMLSPLWKGKKSSDIFQAVPSSVGYMEPLEDSAWSQNVDSAASMYAPPTLPLTLDLTWGEDYQDLSSWCSKLQPETAADTEGTALDDELNTPVVGIQHDFNFTASCNVLKENNTSQYLSEGWDTSPLLLSPPLYVPQKSSLKEPLTKTDTDNTRSATANEFFIDGFVLPVSHEEEIVTSHNMEGLNLEFVRSKESDSMKKSVNLYALGVPNADKSMDIGNYRSVGKDSLVGIETETDKCTDIKMLNRVANTGRVGSLGSLLGSDFFVKREVNDPVHTNQLQAEENLDLKNVLSADSFHNGGNDEMKSVDETWGCDAVVSKVTDTVLSRKCEIIRPRPNTYMMQTLGCEEGAGKAASVDGHTNAAEFTGQKETTTSIFGTDIPAQTRQQSVPVNSELTGTAEHVGISAKSLAGMSLEPLVAGTHANEDVPGVNLGMQPQMAIKEERATEKNMKLLNLSTVWEGTDDSSIGISTPDVVDFLLKQNANFDLIGYVFSNPKEFQQDLLPVNGDDRISVSYTDETAKVEPIIEQVEQSPNVAESLDDTVGDAAVKVEVVEPFCVTKLDEQNDSVIEPMELVEGEAHSSPERRSDQPSEGRVRTNVNDYLKGKKGHQRQKFTETRKGLLKSRILQDGTDLRLTISKFAVSTGQTGSKRLAVPQRQVPQKENGSELKELPLSKRTRGRPAKQELPSTSEVKNETSTTNRSPRRKSCPVGELWISPSKRIKLTSGESCDRYRELRDKNNEASRKSRQNRKARDIDTKEYATKLACDNQTLKIKADEMERLVKKLRQALLEAVVKTQKQSEKSETK